MMVSLERALPCVHSFICSQPENFTHIDWIKRKADTFDPLIH